MGPSYPCPAGSGKSLHGGQSKKLFNKLCLCIVVSFLSSVGLSWLHSRRTNSLQRHLDGHSEHPPERSLIRSNLNKASSSLPSNKVLAKNIIDALRKRISGSDLVVVFSDREYLDFTLNSHASFQENAPEDTPYVVVGMDKDTVEECTKNSILSFLYSDIIEEVADSGTALEDVASRCVRMDVVRKLQEAGFNVLLLDSDISLAEPFDLLGYVSGLEADFSSGHGTFPKDMFERNGFAFQSGFYFVKANEVGKSLMDASSALCWKLGNGQVALNQYIAENFKDFEAMTPSADTLETRIFMAKAKGDDTELHVAILGRTFFPTGCKFIEFAVAHAKIRHPECMVSFNTMSPTLRKVIKKKSLREQGAWFLDNPLKKALFWSFPGSGNTMLRLPFQKALNSTKSKPYFVVHVGPPKSATTTLQRELSTWQKVLRIDGYSYAGLFTGLPIESRGAPIWHILRNSSCQSSLYQARIQNKTASSVPCWETFLQELDKYEGQSIVVSNEIFSFNFHAFKDIGWAAFDWTSLERALQDRWHLVVVVGYRRLTEWIPSAKHERDRWHASRSNVNLWPGQGGKVIQPLFPYVLQQLPFLCRDPAANEPPSWYTRHQLYNLRPHAMVRIMNMHAKESIRSTFFCRVLPNAPISCNASRAADLEETEKRLNPSYSLFYDMLVTAAAENGLVNREIWRRHDLVVQAQQYQEKVLNLTAMDFALTCPSIGELETLLNASLQTEEVILPDFHRSEWGEKRHRRDFWKAVEQKRYCSIDTTAVLQTETWQNFFKTSANRTSI